MQNKSAEKVFLVYNTACFGDNLICNSLCQNIKIEFPDSKVVFICDKPFYEVAKHQKDVDDVIIYDKRGANKGFKGMLKFIKEFPYKKPYASFITYRNLRNILISRIICSKYVFQSKKFKTGTSNQQNIANLLARLTKKPVQDRAIRYEADNNIPEHLKDILNKDDKYVALCTLTKKPVKDMPTETAIDLIKKFNSEGEYKVIFTGAGKNNEEYAQKLKDAGCDFINVVNKTSIYELAEVLNNCKGLISVDTGTMHLGCALGLPVLAVFYETGTYQNWGPRSELYNSYIMQEEHTPQNIYDNFKKLISNLQKVL